MIENKTMRMVRNFEAALIPKDMMCNQDCWSKYETFQRSQIGPKGPLQSECMLLQQKAVVHVAAATKTHGSAVHSTLSTFSITMTDSIELSELGGSLMKRRSHATPESSQEFLNLEYEGDPSSSSPSSLNEDQPFQWKRPQLWKNKLSHFFVRMWQGPEVPMDFPPRPIESLRWLEEIPSKFRKRTTFSTRSTMLAIYLAIWLFLWVRTVFPYISQVPMVAGSDAQVISLTCDQADSFWKGKNSACGLNAESCPSVDTKKDVFIRCPALCDRGSWLYSLRAVGDQVVKYRGYFVGGGRVKNSGDTLSIPYRADSFPCGAAVHSGVISPIFGGCARLSYSSGSQDSFKATQGYYGVSDSINFDSVFPYSYFFKDLSTSVSHCYDPRFPLLLLNILMGIPVVFLASGVTFFWVISIVGFWTISLATDPPVLVDPYESETLYQLISVCLERFLPTCFILYFLWSVSVKRTFESVDSYMKLGTYDPEVQAAQTESANNFSVVTRLLLWYPLFWLGVLNNVTFDRLPVDRLTWHDLQVQPGALMTVMIVSLILIFCVVAQAYYVWLLGRFWKLLLVYGLIFGFLFLIANIPGLTLRIHHYIFGLVFIPGCGTRGRTAYAFQGILLGLFLSGVARWGYASIAETNISLLRGEPVGNLTPPEFFNIDSGTIYWREPDMSDASKVLLDELSDYTEVSILINDIEKFKGKNVGSLDFKQLFTDDKDFKHMLDSPENGAHEDTKVYLRIAKYSPQKKKYGDYSSASVLRLPSFNLTIGDLGLT